MTSVMGRAAGWHQFTTFRADPLFGEDPPSIKTNPETMKHSKILASALMMAAGLLPTLTGAQVPAAEKKLDVDCHTARIAFIAKDPVMKEIFDHAYAHVIFPNVGKGGLIVGGAHGNGILYRKGKALGRARLTQVSAGLQAGGQAFSEVIFFENEDALKRFQQGDVEFSASVSAVLVKEGAAAQAKYTEGVMVFVMVKGGLMLEVSVGGQQFSYKAF